VIQISGMQDNCYEAPVKGSFDPPPNIIYMLRTAVIGENQETLSGVHGVKASHIKQIKTDEPS
jgi:hypothetical protein